jgi:hypothetical protein
VVKQLAGNACDTRPASLPPRIDTLTDSVDRLQLLNSTGIIPGIIELIGGRSSAAHYTGNAAIIIL